jgi:hypothetical protein
MDFVRGLQDCLIKLSLPDSSADPRIFLEYSVERYCGAGFPKKVLKVQWTRGKMACFTNGMVLNNRCVDVVVLETAVILECL